MKGLMFCKVFVFGGVLMAGSVCFAAEGVARKELKTAGLFGLPIFGGSSCSTGSCGSSYGYSSACPSGNCYSTARYPSYGYGYSNNGMTCGPTGCFPTTPAVRYPSTPVMYPSNGGYSVPGYGTPTYTVPYSAPYGGYSSPNYAPYAPVNYGPTNYGVPYGSQYRGNTTAGYRGVPGNSPFYP